jgi:hypothetical protein
MRGQGVLEYLLMLAVALVIVVIVVNALSNAVNSVPEVNVWTREGAKVVIWKIHYDARGWDRLNLNDEYVVLKNIGDEPVNLEGWMLMDETGHRRYEKNRTSSHIFVFPNFILRPGAIVTVHSGKGTNNATDLYWGSKSPIWNNQGDRAYLYNNNGSLVDQCSWHGRGSGEVICH